MFVNELHQGGIRAIIDYDNTVFDNMTLPEEIGGDEVIEQIVDRILFKYGDAPLFSPDPSVIKFYIGRWSTRRAPLWLRYYNAVTAEYDPLWNYDRTEKREFTHGKKVTYGGTVTDATSGTVTNTPSGTITDSADYSVTNTIAADNSANFENDTKASTNGKTNERTYTNYKEEQTYNQYQEQRTYNNSDTNSGKDTEEVHMYGNIGVTSSVDLVKQELDLVPMLDFIDYVADDWHNEFCLMMYY